MSDNKKNQKNKEVVWDFWQRMNYATPEQVPTLVRAAVHEDINWNGPHPINRLQGADALITDFWQPRLRSLLMLKMTPLQKREDNFRPQIVPSSNSGLLNLIRPTHIQRSETSSRIINVIFNRF